MSDNVLKGINVNLSSGLKVGGEKIISFLADNGYSDRELNDIRAKAFDYSTKEAVVSSVTMDVSRLSINNEVKDYPLKKLTEISEKKNDFINLEEEANDQVNYWRRKKEAAIQGYEYICQVERLKQYSVNAKYLVTCIDEYISHKNRGYDLNNVRVEEEDFVDDENDEGVAHQMGDLDINGEHQHA